MTGSTFSDNSRLIQEEGSGGGESHTRVMVMSGLEGTLAGVTVGLSGDRTRCFLALSSTFLWTDDKVLARREGRELVDLEKGL